MKKLNFLWTKKSKWLLNVLPILPFSIFISFSSATSFTWGGSTGNWNDPTKWTGGSGSNYPSTTSDNATINSGTVTLNVSVNLNNFTISGGTLTLNGFDLVTNNVASFSGGTINANSSEKVRPGGTGSATATYSGTTFGAAVDATAPKEYFNGSTFNNTVNADNSYNSGSVTGTGGNTFGADAVFTKSAGSGNWSISNTNPNTFNTTSTFINNSSGIFYVAQSGQSSFGDDITIGSGNNAGTLDLGNLSNTIYFSDDFAIDINGFNTGTLKLTNWEISFGSNLPFNFTSGGVTVDLESNRFFCVVSISAPKIQLKNNEFVSPTTIEQNGNQTIPSCYGGNIYYNPTQIIHSGSGTPTMKLAGTATDYYYDAVTFTESGSGKMRPSEGATIVLWGDLNYSGQVKFDEGLGSITFQSAGGTQYIDGPSSRTFKEINVTYQVSGDPIGTVFLNIPVFVEDLLDLNYGIINSSTDLITCNTSCTVNSSCFGYVDGPIAKVGNSAFVFPTGDGSDYRPLEMSAPSSSTYKAEYIISIPPSFTSLTGTLVDISGCDYWTFSRTSGSSTTTPTVTLPFDPSTTYSNCFSSGPAWTSCLSVAGLNSNQTQWQDWSNGGVNTGVHCSINSVINSTAITAYNTFTIGRHCVPRLINPFMDNNLQFSNNESNFNIFPNPTNLLTTLQYSVSQSDNAIFQIVDVTGKVLLSQSLSSDNSSLQVNTSTLSPGIYFCNLINNGIPSKQEKLIIAQ